MSTPSPTSPTPGARTPRVLAVVVAHDGAEWLPATLRTLAAQRYPSLTTIAVDCASTDGSADVLRRRLGESAVVALDDNVGFGRAVAAAVRSDAAVEHDYLLLVHDDLALLPDAVQWLVEAMESDRTRAVVGPKLREWSEEALLQQVGMSADPFLHPEADLEPGELDQGQQDHRDEVLWVSSAGMLLRGDVFATLGGFDPRYGTYGEDLDLCWRAWLAGRRVAVVPQAVGYHHAAASTGRRPAMPVAEGRYLRERNALATTLKNASARRLAWLLPVGALLNLVRAVALLLARRVGDAGAIARAYVWNLAQLPATLRRRRVVQQLRRRDDREIRPLFAGGLPRGRAYAESVMELLAGGSTRALVDADDVGRAGIDPLADRPLRRFVRDRPLLLVGAPLAAAFLIGMAGYYGPGPIVGGEVAPWPEDAGDFLRAYLSPWAGEPLGSASFPSPVQALLGLLTQALGGSAWLAQRVLVFGLVPLAFATTLRAGRLVTSRPWPRVVGAIAYAVAPAVLAPLGGGRYGLAVVAALLPAVVSLTITTANPSTPRGTAWRATGLLSACLVTAVGAAPVDGLVALLTAVAAGAVALLRGWVRPLLRLAVGTGGAVLLLSPWLFDLVRDGGPAASTLGGGALAAARPGATADLALPAWRALLGQPSLEGLDGVLGAVVLAVPAAVVLGALVVGMRARPLITGALLLLAVSSGGAAWAAAHLRLPWIDPLALLLPAAVATAVLASIVARWSGETLTASDFGLRQVLTAVAGLLLLVGLAGGVGLLAIGPWSGLRADPQLLPAFIAAEEEQVGEYRVLLLDVDADGLPTWEVTGAEGPTMLGFGALRDAGLTDLVGSTVTRSLAGGDPGAAATLGVLNIRYVVLQSPAAALQRPLSAQVDLEPLPSTAAVTYRVRTWLPRAGALAEPGASRLLASGDPGPVPAGAVQPLATRGPGDLAGTLDGAGGVLVVAEAATDAWRAAVDGRELPQLPVEHVNAFALPEGGATGDAVVAVGGGLRRRAVVALQVLVAVALLSLAVRPPGRREDQRREESLPTELVGLADTTTSLPRIDPSAPDPTAGGVGR